MARGPLKRVIQRRLQDPLAQLILEGKIGDGAHVKVSACKTGLTINGQEFAASADELADAPPAGIAAELGDLAGDDRLKRFSLGIAECGADGGVGGVAAARHQQAADAGLCCGGHPWCARRRPGRPRTRR